MRATHSPDVVHTGVPYVPQTSLLQGVQRSPSSDLMYPGAHAWHVAPAYPCAHVHTLRSTLQSEVPGG